MPGKRLDKAKREAAAHTLSMLYLTGAGHVRALRLLTKTNPPSGTGLGDGLTEREIAFIEKLTESVYKDIETMQKLAWRLQGQTPLLRGGVKR